jgi:hypothetical protein
MKKRLSMTKNIEPLDQFWGDLLSRDPILIRNTFVRISKTDQGNVCRHLEKMANEKGWHPEQKKSAQVALDVIINLGLNNHL